MFPRFDFHMHTKYSDGNCSVSELVEISIQRGLKTIAITDHGPEHVDGISMANINAMIDEVKTVREITEFPVLTGIEANIGTDGELDLDDEVLDEIDIVLAAVHTLGTLKIPEAITRKYLDIIERAIRNYEIDVLAHPFWLYEDLSQRLSSQEVEEFAKLAKKNKVAIELNERYRTPSREIMSTCINEGVKVSIGSDAHSPEEVGKMKWVRQMLNLVGVKRRNLISKKY